MKNTCGPLFICLLTMLAGCKLNFSSQLPSAADTATTPVDSDQFSSSVLSTYSFNYGAGITSYDLIKSQSGSKRPTYMQWIPNAAGSTAPAVIIYYPYEVIDWSGEAVDSKWSLLTGAQNDDDGPYYNASTSSQISVTAMPHLTAAQNNSLFTVNNVHTLVVYGRYYSGTTVAGDVQAVVDAYRFLDSKSMVDKTKIGIYSGSWGGVGVLYGTKAAASYSLKPKAISLAYPVSDVKALSAYIDSIPTLTTDATKRSQYVAFFDPYKRRLDKGTEALAGQANRYDKYSKSELSSIDSSMFIIHDDWDTLVPVSFTQNLYTTLTLSDKYAYYQRHSSAIDYATFILNHSQATQPVDYATALTWNYMFLIDELTDPTATRVTSFSLSTFSAQFAYMKSMHDAGKDTTAFNKTLGLMCRANLFMNNVDTASSVYGGSFVFWYMMENYYQAGWSADATAACAKLITTPPF